MTSEQFARERDYGASIAVARTLRNRGLINPREYKRINRIFRQKYHPVIGD